MAIKTNNDGVIVHITNVFRERGTSFGLSSLLNSPLALRRLLEEVLGVNWNVTCLEGSGYSNVSETYSIKEADVVLLVDTSANPKHITLPNPSTENGRIIVVKDSGGLTWKNAITISGSLQNSATEIQITSEFGGVALISGCTDNANFHKWYLIGSI